MTSISLAQITPRRRVRGAWVLAALTLGSIGSAHAGELTGPPTRAWDLPPHRGTVFLNFDGGALTKGSNAAQMQAQCFPGGMDVLAWDGTADERAAIVAIVQEAMAPFGVRIVDERPPQHLPYSQVLFGGNPDVGAPSATCSVDCGDLWWRETGYVWPAVIGDDPQSLANAALNVIGRHAGLDFTDDISLYSNIFVLPDPRQWGSECTALYADASLNCIGTHEQLCGDGTQLQNDVAELTAVYGEDSIDTVAPTVQLLAPADGAELEPGAQVEIEVEVSDDFGGVGWRLLLPGLGQEVPAYKDETTWSVTLPEGVHVIRVEAIDHDRNVGADEVTVYVGVPAPPDPDATTTGDPTTGETTTGEPTTGETPTTDAVMTGGEDSGASEDAEAAGSEPDGDRGCTCSARARSPGAFGLLVLLALGFTRRRRGAPLRRVPTVP